MNENLYPCRIIEDLIPLYCEGLCSDETKSAVEAHIKDCDACRILCRAKPETVPPEPERIPDETKVFKKVRRTLTKHKWLDRILILLLAVLLLGIGVLSLGQIMKEQYVPSFETVFETMRIRKLTKEMARGDFSTFVNVMSYEPYGTHLYTAGLGNLIYETAENMLTESYAETFGDTKLKSLKVKSGYQCLITYGNMLSEAGYRTKNYAVASDAMLEFADGRFLRLTFYPGRDGGYFCYAAEVYNSGAMISDGIQKSKADPNQKVNPFCRTMYYLSDPDILAPRGWMEKLFLKTYTTDKDEKLRADSISLRFSETVRDSIYDNVSAFCKQYQAVSCTISHMQFDSGKKELYWTMTLEAKDDKGTAVLLTRFTRDISGLLPQEPEQNTVYTDGCSPALADALRNLFAA